MKEMICYILLLVLIPRGNAETQCSTYEDTTLKCTFSKNVNSTQTEFRVYFYSENGNEELLIDCVWINGELQCLKQEGLQYKLPVSDIAEISVPTRFKGRSGTYRCIDNGSGPEDVQSCRFYKRHKERHREIQHVNQTTSTIHSNDEDKEENYTAVVAGAICGVVAVIILGLIITVMYMKCFNKSLNIPKSTRSSMDKFNLFLLQSNVSNYEKLVRQTMTFPRANSSQQDHYKISSTNCLIENEHKSRLKKAQTL